MLLHGAFHFSLFSLIFFPEVPLLLHFLPKNYIASDIRLFIKEVLEHLEHWSLNVGSLDVGLSVI